MIIAPAPPADIQPQVTLSKWCIVKSPSGDLYFVGYCVERCSSNFSTAVQYFDPTAKKGITLSGRIYYMVGPPGLDADGQALLDVFRIHNEMDYINVTASMLGGIYSKIH